MKWDETDERTRRRGAEGEIRRRTKRTGRDETAERDHGSDNSTWSARNSQTVFISLCRRNNKRKCPWAMVREGTEHHVSLLLENKQGIQRDPRVGLPIVWSVLAHNTFKMAGVILYKESRQKGGAKYLSMRNRTRRQRTSSKAWGYPVSCT